MYIIEDIWREIKLYLFHNIKIHGKHLKNDKHIKKYNKVMKQLPIKYIPASGPRIVYQSNKIIDRCAKFLYRVQAPCTLSKRRYSLRYKLIIEYVLIGNYTKDEIREQYFNNVDFLVFNNDFLPSLQNT
tara:strand:- start:586 stop:972 length:387 start_codon:yes stop_codon:yes gene_type:complete